MSERVVNLNSHPDVMLRLDPERDHTVGELLLLAARLMGEYGERAVVRFNAGYNNISVDLWPGGVDEEPVPSVKRKPRADYSLKKDTRYPSLPTHWFVSQAERDKLERFARDKEVTLHLYAGSRLVYKVPYRPALLQQTAVNAIGGRPYWLVDVETLDEERDGLVVCS